MAQSRGADRLSHRVLIHYGSVCCGQVLQSWFRRSTLGRKWRKARAKVGLPDHFRLYDLRHTGHTLTTRSGATLKDTMVRAGQSTERVALIYQHSDVDEITGQARSASAWTSCRPRPPGRGHETPDPV